MRKMTRSDFLKFSGMGLGAVGLTMLTGCGSSSSTDTSSSGSTISSDSTDTDGDAAAARVQTNGQALKDKVVIAYPIATSLTPWGTTNKTPGAYEVYESLYMCDDNDCTTPLPILADASKGDFLPGMEHEDGSCEYTVYIYDYIYDHNGNHVTASDVAFSYNHQWQSETTSGWGDFVSIEAVDDTTVLFTFTEEQADLVSMEDLFCKCYIVSEETYNASSSSLLSEMIGTGPYKMSEYVPGDSVTLALNEDYWQTNDEYRQEKQAQNVETIVYQFISDTNTKLMAMMNGEVDMTDDVTTLNAADFADGGSYSDAFDVYTYSAGLIYNLWCNCSDESICGDINMRLAIFYAIDLEGMYELMGATDASAFTYASASATDYCEEWEDMDNYNTFRGTQEERDALVTQYLTAAGYAGETLNFMYQSDQSDFATVVIGMLSQYGISVESISTNYSGAATQRADASGWDMEFSRWGCSYCPVAWTHIFDWANTTEGDHTPNYIYDEEWQELLEECNSLAGHSEESMTAWLEVLYENAYAMNTYEGVKNIIYSSDVTSLYLYQTSNIIPGACEYDTEG